MTNFINDIWPYLPEHERTMLRKYPNAELKGVFLMFKVPQEDGTVKAKCLVLGEGVIDWDNWVGPTEQLFPLAGSPGYVERNEL